MSDISVIRGNNYTQFKTAIELICNAITDEGAVFWPPVYFKFKNNTITFHKCVTLPFDFTDFVKFPFRVPLDIIIDLLWAWLLNNEPSTPWASAEHFHDVKLFKKGNNINLNNFSLVYTNNLEGPIVLTRL